MKRILPLLFLLPTIALLVYARRARTIEEAERAKVVEVVVETGGYDFGKGVMIRMEGVQHDRVIPAVGGRVTFPVPGPALLRIGIEKRERGDAPARSVPLGEPHAFEIRDSTEPQREIVGFTRGECEAALAALRKPQ